MAKTSKAKPRWPFDFKDTLVIYHSSQDACYIAHGLRTDQIGTGDRIVDALADLLRAIDQILALAQKDQTIAYQREAPCEIRQMLKHAKKHISNQSFLPVGG